MGWMRMMGRESVAYHRQTVIGHGDDFPGQALAYYASRGVTPLMWVAAGPARWACPGRSRPRGMRRSSGPAAPAIRAAVSGWYRGAGRAWRSSYRRTNRWPSWGLSRAEHMLGVNGRAEHMHLVMDAERNATLAYLDRLTRLMGGRRGQAAVATGTGGLIYAHTRHATSRAGDPSRRYLARARCR
jgi:TrwC relaxase